MQNQVSAKGFESLQRDRVSFGFQLIARPLGLLFLILTICAPLMVAVKLILRPIADFLAVVRTDKEPVAGLTERACRRLLNLPFIFVPLSTSACGFLSLPRFLSPAT
jgi:hypothetical protein